MAGVFSYIIDKTCWINDTHCFSHNVKQIVPGALQNSLHFQSRSDGQSSNQPHPIHVRPGTSHDSYKTALCQGPLGANYYLQL